MRYPGSFALCLLGMLPFCYWTAQEIKKTAPPSLAPVAFPSRDVIGEPILVVPVSVGDLDPVPTPPAPRSAATEPKPEPKPLGEQPIFRDPLPLLHFYAYSETPVEPAKIALAVMAETPEGSPHEEVERAADAFGISHRYMRTVAKIESDFNPRNRTGKYSGLYQLSDYEFRKYGSGSITDARDNAVAAAYKFTCEAAEFEFVTHRRPTFSDLYLIHQQGSQGAREHVEHPDWPAWRSMCATDEGRQKGERWCKKAIWGNTLPVVKSFWKSVEAITSGAFVQMWVERVNHFAGLFSSSAHAAEGEHAKAKTRAVHAHQAPEAKTRTALARRHRHAEHEHHEAKERRHERRREASGSDARRRGHHKA
jgi:hypothetical protein